MRKAEELLANTRAFAAEMTAERSERQHRRGLDRRDFDRLRNIGFQQASVPVEFGGLWEDSQRSIRALSDAHRVLAAGDPSLALSASMHPGVLAFWRDVTPPAAGEAAATWDAQKRHVFASTLDGAWWGTITSEPGSGGDIAKTRARARRDSEAPSGWRISGEKHFGSGSSVTSYMVTAAVPEDEAELAWFFLKISDVPWDGSTGMTLRARWDGHGMAATDSHGFVFQDFPATRFAWPGHW
jgi:alkylation response protein AidB-like acyl-CoA dehydrogenase